MFAGPDTLAPAAMGAGLWALEQASGEAPLWQPWIFSGMPTLHAFTNVSRLYMPNILVDIQRSFGIPVFWTYFQHMIFSGLGCFLLLRRIGVSSAASLHAHALCQYHAGSRAWKPDDDPGLPAVGDLESVPAL